MGLAVYWAFFLWRLPWEAGFYKMKDVQFVWTYERISHLRIRKTGHRPVTPFWFWCCNFFYLYSKYYQLWTVGRGKWIAPSFFFDGSFEKNSREKWCMAQRWHHVIVFLLLAVIMFCLRRWTLTFTRILYPWPPPG